MKVRTKIAALGVAAVSLGTLAAFAAWTSTVDGTGSAKSTTSDPGTGDIVAVTPVVDDDLYPGASKFAYVTIENDNAYPIIVKKIWAGHSEQTSGGCVAGTVRTEAASDAAGLLQNGSTTQRSIAGGASAVYKLTLRMSNSAADNCKSQSFTIGDDATDDGTGTGQDSMNTTSLHADVESAATNNSF
jgi:hypothetical protein